MSTCHICLNPIEVNDSYRLDPAAMLLAHSWCLGDVSWDEAADAELFRNLSKPRYVVVVWDCDRAMGGHEEGGWSYETGDLEVSIGLHDEATAEAVRDALETGYPRTGQRGMYSKRGPDYSVVILDRENEYDLSDHFDERLNLIGYYPLVTPHYE